jgi:hypothetical protein
VASPHRCANHHEHEKLQIIRWLEAEIATTLSRRYQSSGDQDAEPRMPVSNRPRAPASRPAAASKAPRQER